MSRVTIVIVSATLGLLALLALDDITTGSEPSFALEWLVVAATALWFAGLAWLRARA